jgi:hypothetical protein
MLNSLDGEERDQQEGGGKNPKSWIQVKPREFLFSEKEQQQQKQKSRDQQRNY